MLDSYTSTMCMSSWGRSTYARVLIEVSVVNDLMDSMVVAIPLSNGKGHSFATVEVEYEWRPPRCAVKRKKHKSNQNVKSRQVEGIRLSKPAHNFYYRKVEKGETSKVADKGGRNLEKSNVQISQSNKEDLSASLVASNEVQLKNSFSSLGDADSEWEGGDSKLTVIDESDSEDVDDELIMKGPNVNTINSTTGASTPESTVPHD
nr:zinc knuckle CX2CX4HX4C [Tanacetum cinerariifolium]